jgi:hypothetical protein
MSYSDKLNAIAIAKSMTSPALCVSNLYDTFEGLKDRNSAMNVAEPVISKQYLGYAAARAETSCRVLRLASAH